MMRGITILHYSSQIFKSEGIQPDIKEAIIYLKMVEDHEILYITLIYAIMNYREISCI